ncbi:MAG: hypothetical protein JNM32_10115 [Dechloromonas sp.]|nr:hypothetical protein [Dechloromonas sp.]
MIQVIGGAVLDTLATLGRMATVAALNFRTARLADMLGDKLEGPDPAKIGAELVNRFIRGFRVTSNIGDTKRYLFDVSKQANYATAVALTRTAKRLVPIMENAVRAAFDMPTPFTVRAFGTTPATKNNLAATLFIKDRQAKYLRLGITGGARNQKAFEKRLASEAKTDGYWVPGKGVRLNSFGNLTPSQIASIANRLQKSGKYGGVFVGAPGNSEQYPFGIWARPKQGRRNGVAALQPLLIRVRRPAYRARFDFHGIARQHAGPIFDAEFRVAFANAMSRVRPVAKVRL